MTPIATILIPARNEEGCIEESLNSIWRQQIDDLEILVIDDGSTDQTPKILQRIASERRQLRVIHSPPIGLANALQLGLSEARADILLRFDADDLCLPGRIERQIEALQQEPSLGLLGGVITGEMLGGGAPGAGMARYIRWQNETLSHDDICRSLFIESPFAHPALAARTKLLREAGGYLDGDFPEDYELWLRLLIDEHGHVGQRFSTKKLSGEPILCWRDRPNRFTRTNPRCRPEAFRHLKVRYLLKSHLKQEKKIVVWGAGLEGKPFAKELLAQGRQIHAFLEIDPRKIGQKIYGVPVLSAEKISSLADCFVCIAVGAPEAKPLIRKELQRVGRLEGVDCCFVA
jgi:hypothetical protein